MNHWSIDSFLPALLLVILAGAGLGTLLQCGLFKHEKPKSGGEIFAEWNSIRLRGSLATIVGLDVALALYLQFSRFSFFGHKWLVGMVLVLGLLIMVVLIKLRQGGDK